MTWQAAPGSTLLVPSGSKKHLHVIVLGPIALRNYGNAPQIALVSVTTRYPGIPIDSTCILVPGEHEFVKHESWVSYRSLRIDTEAHAQARIAEHVWSVHASCSALLLQRIRAGVCASMFTTGEFRQLFGC